MVVMEDGLMLLQYFLVDFPLMHLWDRHRHLDLGHF